jgi:7,8-dihydro-6-hydroxymethylpterin-pyrophosphokinase
MTRRILIAVGSNIDPQLHVKNGVASLKNEFDKITVSTFYWTKPLQGRNEQPDYLNGTILLRTGQPLEAVRKIRCLRLADTGSGHRRG